MEYSPGVIEGGPLFRVTHDLPTSAACSIDLDINLLLVFVFGRTDEPIIYLSSAVQSLSTSSYHAKDK